MDNPASHYFCCLNQAERSIMRATAIGLVETLFVGIPVALWDALWIATLHNSDEYKLAFIALYGLEIVTIEGMDGDLTVVRPRDGYLPFWVDVSLFILTPAGACLGGCTLSQRPTP